MEQCQKESQRHGFCSKHLSQMREPNTFSHHMQRFVGSMGNFPHVTALPFLAEFYQRRFDYGPIPPPPPLSTFYHPMIPIPPTTMNTAPVIRSYSTPSPSSTAALLVNSNRSSSAFLPLLPIVRQHSVDMTPPLSSSSSITVLSNHTNSSIRRSSDEDDSEVDIETLPSPSKTKTNKRYVYVSKIQIFVFF
jgi:hypothetical protein